MKNEEYREIIRKSKSKTVLNIVPGNIHEEYRHIVQQNPEYEVDEK
jgi:hypothetical protein